MPEDKVGYGICAHWIEISDIGIPHTYKISFNRGYLSCRGKSSKLDLLQG